MLVWNGLGIVMPILAIALLVIFSQFSSIESDYAFIYSLTLTGLFSWVFGKQWNAEQIVEDEETGQLVRVKNGHSLFWIPMQYAGIICIGLALIILFQNSVTQASVGTLLLAAYLFIEYKNPVPNPNLDPSLNHYLPQTEQSNPIAKTESNNNDITKDTEGLKKESQSKTEKIKNVKDMTEEERMEYYKRYMPK